MRRVFQTLVEGISNKKEVGSDPAGNRYFVVKTKDQGQLREVKYKEYMDIQSVHPLWSGWLGNRRELPPTAEDIRHFEREQAELKEKVAELEEQYKKEKLEERATRTVSKDYTPTDFLDQLVNKMGGDAQVETERKQRTKGGYIKSKEVKPIKPAPKVVDEEEMKKKRIFKDMTDEEALEKANELFL